MKIKEFVKKVQEEAGVTNKVYNNVVDAILNNLVSAMADKDFVSIKNFGTFSGKHQLERKGRNPRTGAAIIVPAKIVPKFKPSQFLKDFVA